MTFKVPEQYRVRKGPFASSLAEHGLCGAFFIPNGPGKPPLKVIASDGTGAIEEGFHPWEHVSVSLPDRCPTWDEMCRIKSMFWDDEDTAMQLHPPKSEWISNHSYCLHLWRPVQMEIPRPPGVLVGYQSLGTIR